MKILLVEDNAFVAVAIEEELRQSGYQVIGPCSRSDHAREILSSESVDCALIDIDLSDGRTGGELAEHAATEYQLPVIFITGQKDLAEARHASALGALLKPLDFDILVETVRQIENTLEGKAPEWPARIHIFRGGSSQDS